MDGQEEDTADPDSLTSISHWYKFFVNVFVVFTYADDFLVYAGNILGFNLNRCHA